jgi:hypothetical protein
MQIHAVTDKTFDVQAALASPEIRAVSRILARAGVPPPSRPIDRAELNAKLEAAGLSIEKRLEIKIALERVGLLA